MLSGCAAEGPTGGVRDDVGHALSRTGEDLPVARSARGARLIDLDRRFQHASLLRTGSDGTRERACVNTVESAEDFLAGRPAGR